MSTTTGPRTIPRNATRQIAALKTELTACKVYTLDNYFIGKDMDPAFAWERLARCEFARLRGNGNGTCTIRVHSNCWYELSAS